SAPSASSADRLRAAQFKSMDQNRRRHRCGRLALSAKHVPLTVCTNALIAHGNNTADGADCGRRVEISHTCGQNLFGAWCRTTQFMNAAFICRAVTNTVRPYVTP